MWKVKIIGAGSIGNHLAYASRQMGWRVDMCDVDKEALRRTREDIFPARYGEWDEAITLYSADEAPSEGYDLVVVGTPPDSHIKLAREAVACGTKSVLIEKPACPPDLDGAQALFDEAANAKCRVFVGYNHTVSNSAVEVSRTLQAGKLGSIETLDVEFREYWGGIFAAHPWLSGPSDSYLGYWKRGGGAAGEHSHAINLWQSMARDAGAGRVREVAATLKYEQDGVIDYDSICAAQFRTENDMVGRVVQDVITKPTRKWARAQCETGFVEWTCDSKAGQDSVVLADKNMQIETMPFPKTRPDDFLAEVRHLLAAVEDPNIDSPLALQYGLDTMLVVAATHLSAQNQCSVAIDYSRGYVPEALGLMK